MLLVVSLTDSFHRNSADQKNICVPYSQVGLQSSSQTDLTKGKQQKAFSRVSVISLNFNIINSTKFVT